MMKTISLVGSAKLVPGDKSVCPPLFDCLGIENFSLTAEPDGDFLVAINHNKEMYESFIKGGGQPERAVLIRLEPDSVFPAQYKTSVTSKYGLVITPGAVSDQAPSVTFVGWPYQYHLNPAKPNKSDPTLNFIMGNPTRQQLFTIENWKDRPIRLTMIAANKVSPLQGANYSVRRKLAIKIPSEVLYVYGPLWKDGLGVKIYHRLAVAVAALRHGTFPNLIGIYGNLFGRYTSARGAVADKHAVLQKSKFSLVIENSNSYVSEKLIDAMINGSIPIYIGPNLQDVGLPSEIAIRSSGDPEEIINIIESLNQREVESILMAMQQFFTSSLFWDSWTEKSVYQKISTEITTYFGELTA